MNLQHDKSERSSSRDALVPPGTLYELALVEALDRAALPLNIGWWARGYADVPSPRTEASR